MRRSLPILLALLVCLWSVDLVAADSGRWNVELIGSGPGDVIYVQVSPSVQVDDPCTCPSGLCGGQATTSLRVSPCPVGQTCRWDTYTASFTSNCGEPSVAPACLGGAHPLTLLRGVAYTITGSFDEGWATSDPATGRWINPCEHHLTFDQVTFRLAPGTSPPDVRLSWDGCDPRVVDKSFTGAGVYRLVLSASNLSGGFSGHDHLIRVGPAIPDAWQFGDGGCQGSGYAAISTARAAETCPSFQGSGALAIAAYQHTPGDGNASLRLANTFNEFTADAEKRYTLWVIDFDHTRSTVGPTVPGNTCGDTGRRLDFEIVASEFLLSSGDVLYGQGDEKHVTWNGSPPVPVLSTTWGRVKGLYR